MRKQKQQHIHYLRDELLGLRERANVFCYLRMLPCVRTEFLDEVRIGQKTNIENEIGALRHAILKAKAKRRNQQRLPLLSRLEQLYQVGAQLMNIELGGVDLQVRYVAICSSLCRSLVIEVGTEAAGPNG